MFTKVFLALKCLRVNDASHKRVFPHQRFSLAISRGITNVKATYLLRELSAAKRQPNESKHENDLITKAFQIYESIEEEPNYHAVNKMLNLCLSLNKPEKLSIIWKDIERVMHQKLIAFPSLIKWSIKTNNFEKGKEIHQQIPERQLNDNVFILCALVNFYGHFKDIVTAQDIFHSIPNRLKNSVSLNTMMTAFINNDYNAKALDVYEKWNKIHDDTSHLSAIKACINTNNQDKGMHIIDQSINIQQSAHSNDLLNTLINFNGHFGDIVAAKVIFKHMLSKMNIDIITINSMMKVLVINGKSKKALQLYDKYSKKGVSDVTRILALQACMALNDLNKGKEIISNRANNKLSIEYQSTVLKFYAHFKDIAMAHSVFQQVQHKNVITVNCMMQAFIDNDQNEKALSIFDEYYSVIEGNHISHILMLKACINANHMQHGQQLIESKIFGRALEKNIMLQTHLIDFSGHFGDVESAKKVFVTIPENRKDGICVSAMMKCLVNNDFDEAALHLYDQHHLLHFDSLHLLAIKAFTKIDQFGRGKHLIDNISLNANDCSSELKTSIIHFYGHFNLIDDALKIYDSVPEDSKGIDLINSMMNAYCECSKYKECIQLFGQISTQKADIISYNTVLKSCMEGHLIVSGNSIYENLKTNYEWMLLDKSIQVNLINMYAEFGMLDTCTHIFDGIEDKKLETWNVMIDAVGKSGDMQEVKDLYERMKKEEMRGDSTTFAILISACSHCGDVLTAENIWNDDIADNSTKYDCFVVTSLVDCFSRKGLLQKGFDVIYKYELIHKDKTVDNKAMWMALLSGSTQCKNKKMTKKIYGEFVKRYGGNESYMAAANTLVSNVWRSQLRTVG